VGISSPPQAQVIATTSYATYVDDNRNELTSETSTRDGSYTNDFAYDMACNPTTARSVSGTTYNSDNQNSTTGYAFDGDGNPSTYSGKGMVFDVEDRLASVTSSGTTIFSAGYNAENMRAWKTESGTTTYYLYAQDCNLPVCELNSSGSVLATNTYTINGLVSRRASSTSTFYEFDPQGSVSERLNASGSCVVSSIADSFGLITNDSSTSDPFGYVAQAGYFTDASTALILTTFRYYDPPTGRFVNRDPIGYWGGIGLYNYTEENPENSVDLLGLAKGGKQSGKGNDPRYSMKCPELLALYAKSNRNAALRNLLKLKGCIGSGNKKGQKHLCSIPLPLPVPSPQPSPQPGSPVNWPLPGVPPVPVGMPPVIEPMPTPGVPIFEFPIFAF
jgi:RHS repeat-associated protein